MKKDRIIYFIITILLIIISISIIKHTDLEDNVALSKSIMIILILVLMRISYGCSLYIKRQYQKRKYSYGIVLNLGLLLFININILRQINLLIKDWNIISVVDIYNNALNSFSFFAYLVLPCIVIISIYSIITNIVLIKREGFTYRNLLGIVLGFLSIVGLFGSQALYLFTSRIILNERSLLIKKTIEIVVNVVLTYLYTLIIATWYCNYMAAKHIPCYDKEYVIILGCKIRGDGTLTPLLKSRVDKAIHFAKEQKDNTGKDIVFVPSGGKGSDEVISEAEAMQKYLITQGIPKKSIMIENKSTSTFENMTYCNQIISKKDKDAKICFSTTNYHVFRSGVIANECGIDCEGMGSNTKWYYYTNALIREFIANIVHERRKHIALIVLMYISISVLILIGYYYHLFVF